MWFWLKPYLWLTGKVDAISLWFKPQAVRDAEMREAVVHMLQPNFRSVSGEVGLDRGRDELIFSHRGVVLGRMPVAGFRLSAAHPLLKQIKQSMKDRENTVFDKAEATEGESNGR